MNDEWWLKLAAKLDVIVKTLQGIQLTLNQHGEKLNAADKQLLTVSESNGQLFQEVRALREDVLYLEFRIGELQEDVDMFTGYYVSHDQRLNKLEADFAA